MHLLKKSVVAAQVAEQRKNQIDEGLSIARKIDALRQTLGALEEQHRKFIEGIKGEMTKETAELTARITELKTEIGGLEAERARLLEPLDQAWIEVRAERGKAEALVKKLDASIARNVLIETKRQEKLEEAKATLSRIKVRERELVKVFSEADASREEARKAKESALTDKARQEATFIEKGIALDKREKEVRFGEEANTHQAERLTQREGDLNTRERQINDKYETLLRTAKRNNVHIT